MANFFDMVLLSRAGAPAQSSLQYKLAAILREAGQTPKIRLLPFRLAHDDTRSGG